MQCSAVQCSAVQCSTALCGIANRHPCFACTTQSICCVNSLHMRQHAYLHPTSPAHANCAKAAVKQRWRGILATGYLAPLGIPSDHSTHSHLNLINRIEALHSWRTHTGQAAEILTQPDWSHFHCVGIVWWCGFFMPTSGSSVISTISSLSCAGNIGGACALHYDRRACLNIGNIA